MKGHDLMQTIYEGVEKLTLSDLLALQKKYIKARHHNYSIVADRNRVDMNVVNSLGNVNLVDIKDICGYY